MGASANPWLIFFAVAVAVGIGFLVPLLVELRRSAKRLTSVLTITEESLPSLVRDVRITLHHVDLVAGDLGEVTGDVRDVTRSVRRVGTSLAVVSGAVSVLGLGFGARTAGLKAGIGAGALYLARHLFSKGART